MEERRFEAQLPAVPHGAAHDLPQHVAAPLVRGHDAVGDEERHRAQVVGDDAHRYVALFHGAAVAAAGQGADGVEDRREERGVVVRRRTGHHCRDALEAHAGVDRGRRQRREHAGGGAIELHEHVVPDLDEALTARGDVGDEVTGAGETRAAIDVDLGTAAARAGVAHRPEVVGCAQFADVFGGHEVAPAGVRLVVARDARLALEDGDAQSLLRQSPHLGEEVPGQRDGVLLEIVAEREVAEHLEEGMVSQRRADVLEVVVLAAHPHALLRRRRPRVGARLAAEEQVLELVHPRVGEEQRGIVVGDERRTGDDGVTVRREVVEERPANLVRMHRGHGTRGSGPGARVPGQAGTRRR